MRKTSREILEKEPLAVGAKLIEMGRVKEATDKAVKAARTKAEMADITVDMRRSRGFIKPANEPIPLKLKKTHCLGDFYGKFHPSKSTKGIKRSE